MKTKLIKIAEGRWIDPETVTAVQYDDGIPGGVGQPPLRQPTVNVFATEVSIAWTAKTATEGQAETNQIAWAVNDACGVPEPGIGHMEAIRAEQVPVVVNVDSAAVEKAIDELRRKLEPSTSGPAMDKRTLAAFCELLMCCDPWPVVIGQDGPVFSKSPNRGNQNVIIDWVSNEARRHGYAEWVDAYHQLNGWHAGVAATQETKPPPKSPVSDPIFESLKCWPLKQPESFGGVWPKHDS